MKAFLLIGIGLTVFSTGVYSQCPDAGLNIQSAACEDPRYLKTDSLTCSTLQVKWTGSKDQAYLVKASYADPATNSVTEAKVSQSVCDDKGNCSANIPVKEGTNISWNVQAVCLKEAAAFYSAPVTGPDTYIPLCRKLTEITEARSMQVYPNPAADFLNVEYSGEITGDVEFNIFDITGKKVLSKPGSMVVKTSNRYGLNIQALPPGVYLLEAHNGKDLRQSKFVILRNGHR